MQKSKKTAEDLAEMIRDGLAEEGFEVQVHSNSRIGWDVAIAWRAMQASSKALDMASIAARDDPDAHDNRNISSSLSEQVLFARSFAIFLNDCSLHTSGDRGRRRSAGRAPRDGGNAPHSRCLHF